MVIAYIHIIKYFWFLIFFIVSLFSIYYFLKLIFGEFCNTQQILKLKAECYSNFGSVQFVHVAQQMQNNNPEAFLTPLRFTRPCRDNSLVEIVDK